MQGINRQDPEGNHLPKSSAEVKNEYSYISVPPHSECFKFAFTFTFTIVRYSAAIFATELGRFVCSRVRANNSF
jgi:hypothetical protein